MNNRRTSFSKSPGARRSFDQNRDSNGSDERRGNKPYNKRRSGRKRSSATESKLPPPRPGSRPPTRKPWEQVKRPKITSELQITDGRHHGKLLENIENINTTVTSRKIREAMFRVLSRRVRAGRFLDLCAGNGTVGMEALSRGAMLGTFVERSARMRSCIRRNLEACGVLDGHYELVGMEAIPFVRRNAKRRRFWDIVYCDPPADSDFDAYLKCFGNGQAVRPGGLLVIEHRSEMPFPDRVGLLRKWRVITKDDTSLSIYERR